MRHSPGFYQRLALLFLQHDIVRGVLSLALLGILLLLGMPVWLALILPFLAYIGMRLLAQNAEPNLLDGDRRSPISQGKSRPYASSLELRTRISGLSGQIQDDRVAQQVRTMVAWTDRCLDVIAEDGKEEAAGPLYNIITFTYDLLRRYEKVCRRGLATAETHQRVLESLTTIEGVFKRLWDQLNREAIVDLDALSESINILLRESSDPLMADSIVLDEAGIGIGGEPEVHSAEPPLKLPGQVIETDALGLASSDQCSVIASLSPREVEVLQWIAKGKTNQQMGDIMFISPRTVAKHVENICGKLAVSNRTEAAALAVRCGLL